MAHVSIPADLSTMLGRSRLPLGLSIATISAVLLLARYSILSRHFALILSNSWLFDLIGSRLSRRQTDSRGLKVPTRDNLLRRLVLLLIDQLLLMLHCRETRLRVAANEKVILLRLSRFMDYCYAIIMRIESVFVVVIHAGCEG